MARRATSDLARSDDTSVLTLRRGLAILDALADAPEGLGVNEAARTVALHKSTVSRLCATLEQSGYVERNPVTGKYQIGPRMYRHTYVPSRGPDLRELARPVLRNLAEACGETVQMVARDPDFTVIEVVEGSRSIRAQARLGQRSIPHISAMGKAILAHMSPDEVKQVLGNRPLPRRTPNTITDRARLAAQLAQIRQQGYSVDLEEWEEGLRCVGAPVFDRDGRVVAGISMSGPRHRCTEEALPHLGRMVRQAAARISARLGAPLSLQQIPDLDSQSEAERVVAFPQAALARASRQPRSNGEALAVASSV